MTTGRIILQFHDAIMEPNLLLKKTPSPDMSVPTIEPETLHPTPGLEIMEMDMVYVADPLLCYHAERGDILCADADDPVLQSFLFMMNVP